MNEPVLLTGTYNRSASAPQDWDAEVRPVERELQRIDPNLRIVWNPQAFLTRVGCYDAEGRAIPPIYEGRWQVVVQGRLDGVDTVIHTLGSEIDGSRKPYRAVGPWLVTFMREWDTANVHQMEALQRMQAESDALQQAIALAAEEKRREESARFATDVLGVKPIRTTVVSDLH